MDIQEPSLLSQLQQYTHIISLKTVTRKWLKWFENEFLNDKLQGSKGVSLYRVKMAKDAFLVGRSGNLVSKKGELITLAFGIETKVIMAPNQVEKVPRWKWTTEEVVQYAIIPWMKSLQAKVPLVDLLEAVNVGEELRNAYFVSHARSGLFFDLLDAINQYSDSNALLWLDIFSVNQLEVTIAASYNGETEKVIQFLLRDGIHFVIKSCKKSLICFDSFQKPTVITRGWCIYETFGMVSYSKDVKLICHKEAEEELLYDFRKLPRDMLDCIFSGIHLKDMKCSRREDAEFITESIKRKLSFTQVSEMLGSQIVAAILRFLEDFVHAKGGQKNTKAIVLWRMATLKHYLDSGSNVGGDYDEAINSFEKSNETLFQMYALIHRGTWITATDPFCEEYRMAQADYEKAYQLWMKMTNQRDFIDNDLLNAILAEYHLAMGDSLKQTANLIKLDNEAAQEFLDRARHHYHNAGKGFGLIGDVENYFVAAAKTAICDRNSDSALKYYMKAIELYHDNGQNSSPTLGLLYYNAATFILQELTDKDPKYVLARQYFEAAYTLLLGTSSSLLSHIRGQLLDKL